MKVEKGSDLDRSQPKDPDRMVLAAHISDFTEERQHQREMQRKALDLNATVLRALGSYQRHRLLIAGSLHFFLVVCGLVLILLDKALYGVVLLVAQISTLVAALLTQHVSPDSEDFEPLDQDELGRSNE